MIFVIVSENLAIIISDLRFYYYPISMAVLAGQRELEFC